RRHLFGRFIQIAGLQAARDRVILRIGFSQLVHLVLLPPLPTGDSTDPQDYSAKNSSAILAKPGADTFALFVLVEQVVNRHAYSRSTLPGSSVVLIGHQASVGKRRHEAV